MTHSVAAESMKVPPGGIGFVLSLSQDLSGSRVIYDWNWPRQIDRELVESTLRLEFLTEPRNVILVAPQGLGKTMIAQNIAHQAVLAGHSVLFTSAAKMLVDLGSVQGTPHLFEQRLRKYTHVTLLAVDEVGYLSYDSKAADLLFQVISARHEKRPLILTTN